MEEYKANPQNDYDDINWEGYMSRQPRFDLRKHNFNFEEYDRYIEMFEQASREDREASAQFYKMVKYVRSKVEAGETNLLVDNFTKKYKLDLIEIPEEFRDLPVEDFAAISGSIKQQKRRRPRVLTRTNLDLEGYDAWRCFDRELPISSASEPAVAKLQIAPALLKRAFG